MSDKLWSVSELASAAGLTVQRIRQLIKEGTIRAQRAGFVWVVPDEEAQRFLNERKEE